IVYFLTFSSSLPNKEIFTTPKQNSSKKINDRYTDIVFHKHYFVDPVTKANTQKIENPWMHLKKIKHYSYGISIDIFPDHLNVFMFFKNLKDIEFSEFLELILN
ncbi:hypothetical protein DMUE_5745, partial [Dictyocoela muelleri]